MQRIRRKIKSESELRALLMEQGLAFSYDLLIDLLKRAVSQQRRQGDRDGIIAQIVGYTDDEISASFRSLDHDVTVTREPGEASGLESPAVGITTVDYDLWIDSDGDLIPVPSLDHEVTITMEPGEPRLRKEMSDGDLMLYLALLVSKLNSWKFVALPHLPKDIVMKHPCDIQADVLLVNAIKRVKPDLYGGTWREMEERLEGYLFSREPDLA